MDAAPKKPTGIFITRSIDALTEEEHQARGPALRRALGPWALIALGLGNMVGAGIFATVGTGIHDYAGPGILLSFAICAVASAFAGLCYAEFSSMVPIAGSAYTYTYATLGEFVAWLIGWNLILEYGMSAAPVASTFSQNIQISLAGVGIHLPMWATASYNPAAHTYFDVLAAAVVIGFALLVSLGVRESAGTNSVLVIIKMGVLAFFVLIALPHFHAANFIPFMPHGWREPAANHTIVGVIPGAFYAFFAFIGFDAVTVAAEEAKKPQRNVPSGCWDRSRSARSSIRRSPSRSSACSRRPRSTPTRRCRPRSPPSVSTASRGRRSWERSLVRRPSSSRRSTARAGSSW